MIFYTKTDIATNKDQSHKDTVAHTDIKFKQIIKRDFNSWLFQYEKESKLNKRIQSMRNIVKRSYPP